MKLITVKPHRGDSYEHAWKLPKDVASTVENKISACFAEKSSDTLRGLTREQEVKYLPDILGVSPNDPSWREATREYWCNIVIIVPPEGLVLNIGIKPDGEPENLADWIKYQFIIKHPDVSSHKEKLEWPKHRFYLVNPEETKKEETAVFELRNRANKAFLFLQEHKDRQEWVAYCLRDKAELVPTDEKDLLMFIETKKDYVDEDSKKPIGLQTFLNVVNDPSLEQKALLFKLESRGVVEKNGNTYFYGNAIMGELKEAIEWLKNPVNSKELFQMNEKLKAETV